MENPINLTSQTIDEGVQSFAKIWNEIDDRGMQILKVLNSLIGWHLPVNAFIPPFVR